MCVYIHMLHALSVSYSSDGNHRAGVKKDRGAVAEASRLAAENGVDIGYLGPVVPALYGNIGALAAEEHPTRADNRGPYWLTRREFLPAPR